MPVLFLVLLLAASFALIGVLTPLARLMEFSRGRRLLRAQKEYARLEIQHGVVGAREHCPHSLFRLSQTGVPGVVVLTHKWCLLCGKNLGTARLQKTWYGHRWE